MRYQRLLENAPALLRDAARRDADCARWPKALIVLSQRPLAGQARRAAEAMQ